MSHFSVFVFSKEYPENDVLEWLMSPYYEGLEVRTEIPFEDVELMYLKDADKTLSDEYRLNSFQAERLAYLSEWYGYEVKDENTFVSYYNPDSKWDWYEVGGRWNGCIKSKNGPCDYCQVGDLVKPVEPPFAFVKADGTWVEEGQMGWFGMSDSTEESRKKMHECFHKYIGTIPDDYWVTIVDCHI